MFKDCTNKLDQESHEGIGQSSLATSAWTRTLKKQEAQKGKCGTGLQKSTTYATPSGCDSGIMWHPNANQRNVDENPERNQQIDTYTD